MFRQGLQIKDAARVLNEKETAVRAAIHDYGISVRWLQHEGRQQRGPKRKLTRAERALPIALPRPKKQRTAH